MVLSVDGYINGPGGEFIPPTWSSDLDAWTDEMPRRYNTLLYGRAAWAEMAAYWPRAEFDPATPSPARELAGFMNSARKIVFSRTLTDARAWANSEIADADVATVVERARARAGKDMVIFAGARFAQTALAAGVVDALSILVVPELFGHGTRLFKGAQPAPPVDTDLDDCRTSHRDPPAVEGPEVHSVVALPLQVEQPWNSGVGQLGDLALDVEVEDGLGRPGTLLGQTFPARAAAASGSITGKTITHEIYISVRAIGGPMPLKVFEERRPVGRQPMRLEVAQRKRKPVIDDYDRRDVFREPLGQPVRDAAARPVLAKAGRRRYLTRRRLANGAVDAQALQTGLWRLGPGIVDADVAAKGGHRKLRQSQDTSVSRLS
jgi:dihydrofolate reductase